MVLLLLLACASLQPAGDSATPPVGDDDTGRETGRDTGEDCASSEPEPGTKDTGDGPRAARSITGSITWTIDFDLPAEEAGYVDCSYQRDYADLVERTDLGYLCPSCTLLAQGSATMTLGHDDCYSQIDDGAATRVEQLGLAESDDGTSFWRSGSENLTLGEVGVLEDGAVGWADTLTLDDGRSVGLTAFGMLIVGELASTVDDPEGARTEPYACDWPQFSPGGPVASYEATLGEVFPNARLRDVCGERMDLWDLRGRYVVVDASSPNCGPCQIMASMAEEFKATMAAQCVEVELVTLLNAGLAEVNKAPDDLSLREWVQTFQLDSPVLADEGFAYAVLAPALNPDGGISLPSIAVLDPDGRMIYLDSGFGEVSGYFDPIEAAILADL
ncbi:MAG: redoxin domain-containing protein [Myxococcales bacterium]|nr:redoxin domain-containing protein [Myxococcales bacterium]